MASPSIPRWLVGLSVVLYALTPGCEDPSARENRESERSIAIDSVQNSPPYPRWTVDRTPVLRIGAAMPEDETQAFSDIRYAAGLSDGRVVVVDGGSSEIRWFNENGILETRAGGRGGGPEELGYVVSGRLFEGDTLVLADWRNQRISWFGPKGTLAGTRRVVLSNLGIGVHEAGNGRILLAEESPNPNFDGAEYNYARDSVFAVLISEAAEPDTILRLLGKEAVTWVDYDVDGEPRGTRQMELPFGRRTLVSGLDELVVVLRAGRGELLFFDLDGRILRWSHRSDLEQPPVSSEFRRRYVEHVEEVAIANGARVAPAREGAERLLGILPDGRNLPGYDRIVIDQIGRRIWLRDFMAPWMEGSPQKWTLHDTRGRVLARLSTPPRFRLMHVARDRLVGVTRDELGVESVTVYRMRPSPP